MERIEKRILENAYTYEEYRGLIDVLQAQGKTTGKNQTGVLLDYTRLNVRRMQRLDKTARLEVETLGVLARIRKPQTWVVLTEAWCGDAAQIIPVLTKMAEASPNVNLRLILRDEHPDIMDAFLTNGARSIPRLIALDDTGKVLGSWGPRPEMAQQIVLAGKKETAAIEDPMLRKAKSEETSMKLHSWYAKDKTRSIQAEVSAGIALFQERLVQAG